MSTTIPKVESCMEGHVCACPNAGGYEADRIGLAKCSGTLRDLGAFYYAFLLSLVLSRFFFSLFFSAFRGPALFAAILSTFIPRDFLILTSSSSSSSSTWFLLFFSNFDFPMCHS